MVQVLNKISMLLYDNVPCICFSNKLAVCMTCHVYICPHLSCHSLRTWHTAHCILYWRPCLEVAASVCSLLPCPCHVTVHNCPVCAMSQYTPALSVPCHSTQLSCLCHVTVHNCPVCAMSRYTTVLSVPCHSTQLPRPCHVTVHNCPVCAMSQYTTVLSVPWHSTHLFSHFFHCCVIITADTASFMYMYSHSQFQNHANLQYLEERCTER
jgi:hypothetical protein